MRICLFLLVGLSALATMPSNARASGHIYLIRGLADIFSTGLNVLAQELTKRGYTATTHGHDEFHSLAVEAAKEQESGKGPIIIIGHSLGANAAVFMADKMQDEGAPVALIVTFSPTLDLIVPSNVAQIVNYHLASGLWKGTIHRGPGFKGVMTNINLDSDPNITHLNIDKIARLHSEVIAKVRSITGPATRKSSPEARR